MNTNYRKRLEELGRSPALSNSMNGYLGFTDSQNPFALPRQAKGLDPSQLIWVIRAARFVELVFGREPLKPRTFIENNRVLIETALGTELVQELLETDEAVEALFLIFQANIQRGGASLPISVNAERDAKLEKNPKVKEFLQATAERLSAIKRLRLPIF